MMIYDVISGKSQYLHMRKTGMAKRAKLWDEDMVARFPKGTFERIQAASKQYESRTDFVREAVERELKRRAGVRKPGKKSAP
jgi:hypothetical protein